MAPAPDRLTLAAFALLVLLGGLNAVAVRVGSFDLPPFWGAALRFGAAGLLLAGLALALRAPLPRGRELGRVLLYGVLNFGAGYAFVYLALAQVGAGLTQVVVSVVPLFTLLFAAAHGVERFRWRGLAGALLAMLGVALVFRDQLRADAPLPALLALLACAACWAEATVVAKGFPRAHLASANAVGMAAGVGLLLGLSALAGEARAPPALPATWLALGYLVLVGSMLLFVVQLAVLRRWTASATSYQFLLLPLVTIPVGAWLLGERVSGAFALGGALVLAGVWVGALSGTRAGGRGRGPPGRAHGDAQP